MGKRFDISELAVLRGVCPAGHERESTCAAMAAYMHLGRDQQCTHGMEINDDGLRSSNWTKACRLKYRYQLVGYVDAKQWRNLEYEERERERED